MKSKVFIVCAAVLLYCGAAHASLSDGLVAYYPFNGNANDESGNGHNGVVRGATLTSDISGNANSAYSFDGSSNYIDLGNWFNFQSFTISIWVNPKSSQMEYADIVDNYHDSVRSFVLQQTYNTVNSYFFGPAYKATSYDFNVPLFTLNSNVWSHIVVTGNGTNKSQAIYINGSLVSSITGTSDIYYDGTQFLRLGKWGRGEIRYWSGLMDDVRIYNRALSASEIQEIYRGQGTCSNDIITFTAGTPAKAADVNANFDALKCQNQALNSQLQALKAIVCKNEPTASVCQ